MAALKAENQRLQAENAKKSNGPGLTVKTSTFIDEKDANGQPGKGTVGCYGLGTRPITAYADQWRRIFIGGAKVGAHILASVDRLGFKTPEQKQRTVTFFEAARPHLEALAALDAE